MMCPAVSLRRGVAAALTICVVALLTPVSKAARARSIITLNDEHATQRLAAGGSSEFASTGARQRACVRLTTPAHAQLMVVMNDACVGSDTTIVARASYTPQSLMVSNMGKLVVQTVAGHDDLLQLRALGLVEGYLTASEVWAHHLNMQWYLSGNTNHSVELRDWLATNQQYIQSQLESYAYGSDPFWDAIHLIQQQVEGIAAGYAMRVAEQTPGEGPLQSLSLADMFLLQAFGDIDDLLPMLDWKYGPDAGVTMPSGHGTVSTKAMSATASPALHPRWSHMTPGQVRARIAKSSRCSAMIKVTPDLQDLLMGHTTWWSYASLVRVYKHLTTQLSNPHIKAQSLSFSSYPGMVTSMDDFLITSAKLVVLETSNDVFDLSLYAMSSNQAALSWHRTRAACMLADDGATWAAVIAQHNSGTYNNQYMVVDLKRFHPGQSLQLGLLTVIETIPGASYSSDGTQELERGYWPSYNVPYFAEVYNQTGVPDLQVMLRARGSEFWQVATGLSYQLAPRAKIFRRDQGNVADLAGLKRLLRSNGWHHSNKTRDVFSPTPWDTICARGDLDPEEPDASGCYDAKVTSYSMALRMEAEAVNGPPWSGDGSKNGQPAFSWKPWPHVSQYGMIPTYKTVFELMSPTLD